VPDTLHHANWLCTDLSQPGTSPAETAQASRNGNRPDPAILRASVMPTVPQSTPNRLGDLNLLSILTIPKNVTLCDWKAGVYRIEEGAANVTSWSVDVIASAAVASTLLT
jgi:hypothetical protein